jgi:hypothetical protein
LAVFLLLGAVVSTAGADSIVPSYTVTDLGSTAATLSTSTGVSIPVDLSAVSYGILASGVSTAAGGGRITTVSVGNTTDPFTFTPPTVLSGYQGIMTNFPLAVTAPVNDPNTYGNPFNAYSVISSPLLNANGIAVAIDSAGVYGHGGTETAYFVQRNADGSWGSATVAWAGSTQSGQGANVGGVTIAGINNLNQILGTMSVSNGNGSGSTTAAVLYNIGTHTLTNLSAMPGLSNYTNIQPVAIDDQGRILLEGTPVPGSSAQGEQLVVQIPPHLPDPVPAPEPGSLAVMVLAIAAFAARRIRERRRRS